MTPAPNRRWLRFSLRTLFVLVALVGCWLTYEMNWVRQRRHEIITGAVVAHDDAAVYARAPGALSIFGEQGYKSITVLIPNCHRITPADKQKAARIRRLFPEAEVAMMSGTPGEFLDRSSPYHPLNRMPDNRTTLPSPESTEDLPSVEDDPFPPE